MAVLLRVVGAIIAGMVTAFVLVVAVELFGAVVHPVPADFGLHFPTFVHAVASRGEVI